jgi:hypothetical protein
VPPPMVKAIVTTPATMFDHRFNRYVSTRDRKIMAIGISRSTANTSSSPSVILTDPAYPVITSARVPGVTKFRMSAKIMLIRPTIHSVDMATRGSRLMASSARWVEASLAHAR